MKIVVKVGTQSILSANGVPVESILKSIVQQIAKLHARHKIVLVTSGAVGYGRSISRQILGREYGVSIGEKQVLASLGQHELMHVYAELFKAHNMLASQLLLTKQDFHTRKHYLNISRLISEIHASSHILPIINENDSVAIEELMFTDNDELSGLIATLINADMLIILSNIAGVYSANPNEPGSHLINTIDPAKGWPNVSSTKSTHGRGGMVSKLSTARQISKLGIMVHIASINEPDVILRLVNGEHVGTKILPDKRQSSIKRWIASSHGQKTGEIYINQGLYDIIMNNKRVLSILPVGIIKCTGDFKKSDVVEIIAPDNKVIGIGLAKYDATKLMELLGQKDKPVFIHYDHLHIF